MVEVDPTSAVVGAAGEVPLIDTFQEPVAAVCVGVRRRVRLRDRPGRVCDVDLIWEQVVVDAHDPVALGRWWAEALGWVVVGDTADEFEIRPTPDRVPGLLFVPVPEEKAGKNRLHPDFRPVDQTAEVERLLSSVLGGPMSGSVTRRGWYSPTLKAMSSASFVDGFGPIPRSR